MNLSKISKPKVIVFGIFLVSFYLCLTNDAAASTIIGIVYDNHRNPVADVDVELQGTVGAWRGRTRTDSTGRYEFGGLGDGRFTVRVLPFRYDFEEQSAEVVVQTFSRTDANNDATFIQDFYLAPRKGSLVESETAVIFAQNIPVEAKKIYEKAIQDISGKQFVQGITGLEESLKIFPEYFLALKNLGIIYFNRSEYGVAVRYLFKASDINPKSPTSFFYLGFSLYKLGYYKAASIALKQSHTLSPSSAAVLLALGTVERLEKDFVNAEKHLKLAKKLTNTPSADLHFQLAKLYGEDLKRYGEAADELEEFLKARPDAKDASDIKVMIKTLREKAKAASSDSKN